MKKKLFLLILLFSSFYLTKGQNIPNGNFETWEDVSNVTQPVPWETGNSEGIAASASAYTPGYNSNTACKLSVIDIGGGYKFEGMATQRFPYNQRPVSFKGAYKVLPMAGDTVGLSIGIFLTKNKVSVGNTAFFIKAQNASADYIPISVDFYYSSEEIPDTAYISAILVSTKNIVNSAVVIDELSFSNSSSSISEINDKISIGSVYPVPANEHINIPVISTKTENVEVKIFDLLGNQIESINNYKINSSSIVIPVSKLESGLYFVNIERTNGEKITKKFIISH